MKLIFDSYLDAGSPIAHPTRAFLSIMPELSDRGGYIAVCREFDIENPAEHSDIRLLWYSGDFMDSVLRSDIRLCRGEDARIFLHNGEHYCLVCRCESGDWSQHVVRLCDGSERRIKLHEGFHGKNWTPFVSDGKILFIRSIEPLSIVNMNGCLVTGTIDNNIGTHRGGSNAIRALTPNGCVRGFGHRTDSDERHVPFFYEISDDKVNITVPELVGLPPEASLVDPTSYWDNYVAVTLSQWRWTKYQTLRHAIMRIE